MPTLVKTYIRSGAVRVVTFLVGVGSVFWVFSSMPTFRREAPFVRESANIVSGEASSDVDLKRLKEELDQSHPWKFRSSALENIAILRLRYYEERLITDPGQKNEPDIALLRTSLKDVLSNVPNSPFSWLMLFWLKNTSGGFVPENLRYLAMSYSLGPNEAWIAVRRNPLAMRVFPALPDELARTSISEFAGLVRSRLTTAAADIIAGTGSPVRDRLLLHLKDVDENERRALAKLLINRDIDASVPGVERSMQRPWR